MTVRKAKKPDKSLFNYSVKVLNAPRRYEYVTLTGEKKIYHITEEEHLVDIICPICGNYHVEGHSWMDSWCNCVCCGINTLSMTPSDYRKRLRKEIENSKKELKELESDIKKLEKEYLATKTK
jgi:hypothetical protein